MPLSRKTPPSMSLALTANPPRIASMRHRPVPMKAGTFRLHHVAANWCPASYGESRAEQTPVCQKSVPFGACRTALMHQFPPIHGPPGFAPIAVKPWEHSNSTRGPLIAKKSPGTRRQPGLLTALLSSAYCPLTTTQLARSLASHWHSFEHAAPSSRASLPRAGLRPTRVPQLQPVPSPA